MKKPFKGKGEQTIEIMPGNEEVILLRIKNSDVKEIKFPPPMDLQILPILWSYFIYASKHINKSSSILKNDIFFLYRY